MTHDLPENVKQTLDKYKVEHIVFPCDPEFADTDPLIEKYGYPREQIANTIIVVGRSEPRTYIACVVLATHKVDVNKRVRKLLSVKSASFASSEQTVELTGMMIGGVTVFGLPETLPIWVDSEVFKCKEIMVGGGNRSTKVLLDPKELMKLPSVQEVSELGIRRD
ncbi:MAG TPA: YbaK/EbsC family protein [Candidatus Saccharimonadales bacterium]|nr:YbaK/EbsC family protein [Candidatus Saccharimonadales bacterium]